MRQDMGGLQISLEKEERPWINGPERVCGWVFLEYLEMEGHVWSADVFAQGFKRNEFCVTPTLKPVRERGVKSGTVIEMDMCHCHISGSSSSHVFKFSSSQWYFHLLAVKYTDLMGHQLHICTKCTQFFICPLVWFYIAFCNFLLQFVLF